MLWILRKAFLMVGCPLLYLCRYWVTFIWCVIFCNHSMMCLVVEERRECSGTDVIRGNFGCSIGGLAYNFWACCCKTVLSRAFCLTSVIPFMALLWFFHMLWCNCMADWRITLPHCTSFLTVLNVSFSCAWCHFTDMYLQRNWRQPIMFWWCMASRIGFLLSGGIGILLDL